MRAIGEWLRESTGGIDPAVAAELISRAELAVHEACMNVVNHADLPSGSVIDLALDVREDGLTVTVCDPGVEFDFDAVPSPDPHVLQERGYGVKIIRALVDDFTYRRVGATNELVLQINVGGDNG
jgi:anti-sigma regulatory factor (Ser/Thr protein kinase)